MAKPALALDGDGVKFTFTPASPDAAMRYMFILEGQNGSVWESLPVAFDSSDLVAASLTEKAYTWSPAPSGQLTGKVRCELRGHATLWIAAQALQRLTPPSEPGEGCDGRNPSSRLASAHTVAH